jgi:hypothetical protein
MPEHTEYLLHRLIGGDTEARTDILETAATSTSPTLLVAAALVCADPEPWLSRAAVHAATTRDRQLVAITMAHFGADDDLLDALVRDHLADYPDSLLAGWIAAQHRPSSPPAQHRPSSPPAQHRPSSPPAQHAPSGAPAQHAPSGAPAQHAPSGAPAQHAPSGAPAQHAPSGAPAQDAISRQPTQHSPSRPPTQFALSRPPDPPTSGSHHV